MSRCGIRVIINSAKIFVKHRAIDDSTGRQIGLALIKQRLNFRSACALVKAHTCGFDNLRVFGDFSLDVIPEGLRHRRSKWIDSQTR
jgi:hypothetical protein